ncbi:MAG: hypothetical protein ABR540_20435 [Acidimicrobiales bacterium]|nr:hypothetical protein [Actinomycetota bacterium]
MRAVVVGVVAAGLLVGGCSSGDDQSGPRPTTTRATVAPAGSTTTRPPTLQQWMAAAQHPLNDLADASQGLRTITPDDAALNRDLLVGLADAAGRAEDSLRSQAPPATGQAEVEGFVRTVGELEGQARTASSCEAECRNAYNGVLTAAESLRTALENLLRVAQPGN